MERWSSRPRGGGRLSRSPWSLWGWGVICQSSSTAAPLRLFLDRPLLCACAVRCARGGGSSRQASEPPFPARSPPEEPRPRAGPEAGALRGRRSVPGAGVEGGRASPSRRLQARGRPRRAEQEPEAESGRPGPGSPPPGLPPGCPRGAAPPPAPRLRVGSLSAAPPPNPEQPGRRGRRATKLSPELAPGVSHSWRLHLCQ